MEEPEAGAAPVTVAVVSWNTRDLLVRCLRSLAPEVRAGQADVWVVDNGSADGSAEAARDEAPWATVIEPAENLGFGRAVNLVARQTESEWVCAANADVALEPGALQALRSAGHDARVGCVAPSLVLPDGEIQDSVHAFPTVPFTLAFSLGIHGLSPRIAERMLISGLDRPRSVPWAIGACLLLRRSAFDDVGGFDETQWMYAEDLDLGWRLREAGWLTRYQPGARVRHESAAATRQAFDRGMARWFMDATYDVLLRRRGLARAWMTAALNLVGVYLRLAWMLRRHDDSTEWQDRLDAMWGWRMVHRDGLRRLTGLARARYGRRARAQADAAPTGRTTDQ